MNKYLNLKNIYGSTREKMLTYIEYIHDSEKEAGNIDEESILSRFPISLKIEIK